VRVDATGCSDGAHLGTGFVWPERGRVVTALHTVSSCPSITVYHEPSRLARRATIVKALHEADLALLDVPELAAPALGHAAAPRVQQQLAVVGIELGTSVSSKNLRVAYGDSTLRDITPDNVRRALSRSGVLSLDLAVIRLEGALLPGHSGAPIVNEAGEVVAIGNGGLESGAVHIAWGTPASELLELGRSTESTTQPLARVPELFTVSPVVNRGSSRRCGSVDLHPIGARGFDEISGTTDDPVGLAQLVTLFSQTGVNPNQLRFDLYLEPDDGGTVVLPAGTPLSSGTPHCRASSGPVQLFVGAAPARNPWEVKSASVAFESAIVAETQLEYAEDLRRSHLAPHTRLDGLTQNRKSFVGYQPLTQVSAAFAFETLLARGRSFIGVAAVNRALRPELVRAGSQICPYQPFTPICTQLRAALAAWQPVVLGVFFSTFPIG
jgi:hypothetical protein